MKLIQMQAKHDDTVMVMEAVEDRALTLRQVGVWVGGQVGVLRQVGVWVGGQVGVFQGRSRHTTP